MRFHIIHISIEWHHYETNDNFRWYKSNDESTLIFEISLQQNKLICKWRKHRKIKSPTQVIKGKKHKRYISTCRHFPFIYHLICWYFIITCTYRYWTNSVVCKIRMSFGHTLKYSCWASVFTYSINFFCSFVNVDHYVYPVFFCVCITYITLYHYPSNATHV